SCASRVLLRRFSGGALTFCVDQLSGVRSSRSDPDGNLSVLIGAQRTLQPEKPDAVVPHVRICGRLVPSLPSLGGSGRRPIPILCDPFPRTTPRATTNPRRPLRTQR